MRPPLPDVYPEARTAFFAAVGEALLSFPSPALPAVAALGEPYYAGRFAEALERLRAR
jgi:hypothetical protein